MVASSVTLDSLQVLLAWAPERRTGFCRLAVAQERPIAKTGRYLAPQNPIHVFTFQKEASA